MYLPWNKSYAWGLDLQPESLSLVQLVLKDKKPLIQQAYYQTLSSDMEKQAVMMQSLLQQARMNHKKQTLYMALPCNWVSMQSLQVPKSMKEADIIKEIYQHLGHESIDEQALAIDYVTYQDSQIAYQEVKYAAIKQSYLSFYSHQVQSLGFDIKVMDVDVCALLRALTYLHQPVYARFALVHMTEHKAYFLLIVQQDLHFHRHIILSAENKWLLFNDWLNANLLQAEVTKVFISGFKQQEAACLSAYEVRVLDTSYVAEYGVAAGMAMRGLNLC